MDHARRPLQTTIQHDDHEILHDPVEHRSPIQDFAIQRTSNMAGHLTSRRCRPEQQPRAGLFKEQGCGASDMAQGLQGLGRRVQGPCTLAFSGMSLF